MGTNFAVGDKVRNTRDDKFIGRTGIIIMDGGLQNLGFRKIGEYKYGTSLQQWVVKLDDTSEEISFFEGALEKIE